MPCSDCRVLFPNNMPNNEDLLSKLEIIKLKKIVSYFMHDNKIDNFKKSDMSLNNLILKKRFN